MSSTPKTHEYDLTIPEIFRNLSRCFIDQISLTIAVLLPTPHLISSDVRGPDRVDSVHVWGTHFEVFAEPENVTDTDGTGNREYCKTLDLTTKFRIQVILRQLSKSSKFKTNTLATRIL